MSIRTERVASQIQKDLGDILSQEYQPVGAFVSITKVVMTDDLSIAKVYLSIFAPGRETDPLYERIDRSQNEIRHELAKRIRHQVRRIPDLLFFVDESSEIADKMERLFQKVREQDSSNLDKTSSEPFSKNDKE
jgi:ribosome-binding factor A